ncbi:hypothetical protein GCM10023196_101740 [Actinoallomurus vinaceus]|uniref:DUF397 domain-containing protein n=1 Tax=Actinoallomurus vinaceus TaxID=1080074 RepID=A0ABP8UW20_9ACTN
MTVWRKSSYTTGSGGTTECVEVAQVFGVGDEPEPNELVAWTAEHS